MLRHLSIFAGLMLASQVHASPASPAARTEFRNVMEKIASDSQTQPLICRDSEDQEFRFTLRIENDPNYLEAFEVAFLQDGEIIRSTLIAYLGQAGYPLGQLQIVREGDSVIYRHVFDGYLDDVVQVEALAGTVKAFRYSQVLEGRPVYGITCVF